MALSKKDLRNLVMAFITVFLNTLNYSLIIPILPFIVEEMHATDMQSGILYSGYSLFQLISLSIAGSFSDIYGRKIFLTLFLIGSCVGSLLQYMSTNITQLIIWRSLTGLFAGSNILGQAVVADLTPLEERNKYYARLEALNSAAFILGPAFAGFLSGISILFPLLAASIISGIALIFSFFFLKETNKDIIEINEIKKKAKKVSADEKSKLKDDINLRMQNIKKSRKQESPKLTKLMLLCFIFEFCIRWTINAFDSKYGIFVNEKFDLNSATYSTMICVQSCFTCIFQAFIYPLFVKNIPVPYLAVFGTIVVTISYFFMSYLNNLWGSFIASTFMWMGFTFAVPSSVTIISTTHSPEVQGKVLSWNNLCCQASLITCPLVLSVIYPWNREAIYYFSMILSAVACLIMVYVSTWPNARTLGKENVEEKKDIEMAVVEKKEEVISVEKEVGVADVEKEEVISVEEEVGVAVVEKEIETAVIEKETEKSENATIKVEENSNGVSVDTQANLSTSVNI